MNDRKGFLEGRGTIDRTCHNHRGSGCGWIPHPARKSNPDVVADVVVVVVVLPNRRCSLMSWERMKRVISLKDDGRVVSRNGGDSFCG